MPNIGTPFFFFDKCFLSEVSLLFSCVLGGPLSMHVHRYAEKLFVFVPQRCNLDLIKELEFFFNPNFLVFLVTSWKNFSLEDTQIVLKIQHKQTLSPFCMIK